MNFSGFFFSGFSVRGSPRALHGFCTIAMVFANRLSLSISSSETSTLLVEPFEQFNYYGPCTGVAPLAMAFIHCISKRIASVLMVCQCRSHSVGTSARTKHGRIQVVDEKGATSTCGSWFCDFHYQQVLPESVINMLRAIGGRQARANDSRLTEDFAKR